MDILKVLTEEFSLKPFQVENTVKLIDEGNTIPFISRYRKEVTGGLDDATLREYEGKEGYKYNSYTYAYYYFNHNTFLEGGTKGADGKTTYSDAEKEAGRAAAEAAANTLAASTTVEELDAAIAALEIASTTKSTRYDNQQYASVSSLLLDWVTGDRKAGDITVIPNESTTTTRVRSAPVRTTPPSSTATMLSCSTARTTT